MAGTLSIRKTLVLGLGTTGKEVAEQLAEQLNWQFGSFERAAWVRILVLETEKPTSLLGDRVLHAGISAQEFAPYTTQPRTAGQEFGFYEWHDSACLSRVSNPEAGAGNIRLLGRLCLFHKSTYTQLQSRVMRDISELNQLTPQTIADQLGDPGLQVTIQPETVVYVVGTLCGGTCSGGAADLGYLLDVWSNLSVKRQAIFTLPHPNLNRTEASRYKKNAYYALKELNHYQLVENPWKQRLPGYTEPHVINKPPYDILRVMMPGGPGTEEVQRLNAMIGQYLAAAVGYAGAAIVANDVNAVNVMTSTDSVGFMCPLFSTMGVAALEYPGEHIQRAATSRLQAETLQRWLQYRTDDDHFRNAMRLLGEDSFDALLDRLIQQNGERISLAVTRDVSRAISAETPPRVEEVQHLLRDAEGRLTLAALPSGDVAGAQLTLLQAMESNHKTFMDGLRASIEEVVRRSLFELEGGPGFVMQILRQYLSRLEAWTAEAPERLRRQSEDARDLKEQMNDAIEKVREVEKQFSPIGKTRKLKEGWQAVNSKLTSYMETEARSQALNHLQQRRLIPQMVDQFRSVTAVWMRRLERMQAAFQQEQAALGNQWQNMAKSSPDVNGRAFFQVDRPGQAGTISEVYYDLLRQRRWSEEPAIGWDDAHKEEAAERIVLQSLTPLLGNLSLPDGNSGFDPAPNIVAARDCIPRETRGAMETAAREFFEQLRAQKQVADMVSDADLDSAIQLSVARLGVAPTQISQQLTNARGIPPAPQELAFADLGPEGSPLTASMERVQRRLLNNMRLQRGSLTNSHDPFRILLIREKHGFTFGQMEGVIRANEHDLSALQSSESCTDFSFWHTRRDVNWVDPLVHPNRVEMTEEAWLAVLLLGRPRDGIYEWTPANQEEIDPKGWYQIAGGEFSVFHMEGDADVMSPDMRLPRLFSEATARLLTSSYASLRSTLNIRISSYAHKCGADRLVRAVDRSVRAPSTFGIEGLTAERAERIVRRYYRRNDGMTRAFFEFKTENMEKGREEFAYLWHRTDEPIAGGPDLYRADAYYCPDCHQPLGKQTEDLLRGMFLCPVCNTEERYWPR